MSTRRRAREVVIQILFQRDLNPESDIDIEHDFLKSRLKSNSALVGFAEGLLSGIENNQQSIDDSLKATAENWKLDRMAATDRSIMRLAAFEIMFGDTPGRVAINEAIELAKRYGTNNSAQFVNGVLDRLLKSIGDDNDRSSEAAKPNASFPSADQPPDCD